MTTPPWCREKVMVYYYYHFYHCSAVLFQIKQLGQEQEMLLVSNKSLAEHNMSLEPKLAEVGLSTMP